VSKTLGAKAIYQLSKLLKCIQFLINNLPKKSCRHLLCLDSYINSDEQDLSTYLDDVEAFMGEFLPTF
jgi:hypothetical protein